MRTVVSSEDRSVLDLRELKSFAGLLRYLSMKDVVVRYKQTVLGFGWSVVRPIVNILIFGMLSYLIDPSQSFAEKFISVSAAVIFWQLLSTTITEVSNSLSANANILTKVYFPKLILPISSLLVCLVDFFIAFVIYMIVFLVFRGMPPWQIVFLPFAVLAGLLFSFGFGLIFATASVRFRDVKFILPFLLQVLFYASPIVISTRLVLSGKIPDWLEILYQLNPFVFIMNFFAYCFTGSFTFLYGSWGSTEMLCALISGVIACVIIISALRYFIRFEKMIADYI